MQEFACKLVDVEWVMFVLDANMGMCGGEDDILYLFCGVNGGYFTLVNVMDRNFLPVAMLNSKQPTPIRM